LTRPANGCSSQTRSQTKSDSFESIRAAARLFSRQSFAEALARINHPDLMLGIPLYSDIGSEHDYVVQARGAFEDTVLGLYNLARADVPVEIPVLSLKFRLGCLTLRTL
jgi:hypothetical protein